MNQSLMGLDDDDIPAPEVLLQEYRVLQQFLHLAPVGLLRMASNGDMTVMNPMAAQLLAPLGLGQQLQPNLLEMLEPISQDIRVLLQAFSDTVGVICENFRIMMPAASGSTDGPLALGITVMRVSAADDPLMVVLTDQSNAVKLQRLQGGFMR